MPSTRSGASASPGVGAGEDAAQLLEDAVVELTSEIATRQVKVADHVPPLRDPRPKRLRSCRVVVRPFRCLLTSRAYGTWLKRLVTLQLNCIVRRIIGVINGHLLNVRRSGLPDSINDSSAIPRILNSILVILRALPTASVFRSSLKYSI